MSINVFVVDLIYSFITKSSQQALLFFNFLIHLSISSFEMFIYKNKGDKMDTKNYMPITILSCLEKHFTAVLSERLTKYSDDFFLF
jgi:hypothetical protein